MRQAVQDEDAATAARDGVSSSRLYAVRCVAERRRRVESKADSLVECRGFHAHLSESDLAFQVEYGNRIHEISYYIVSKLVVVGSDMDTRRGEGARSKSGTAGRDPKVNAEQIQ
ncbi:hypothetical protein CLCR_07775 [Cladophialophora carrionii]|uniref:Uncharacterized protein n=1 Tax=Cladophialophora carrionii TaxID=86049 RepID=A0A1C1CQC9_9EURO|nr:hypothetical protein CLCR_07775 [Cladophialophora carrionii]